MLKSLTWSLYRMMFQYDGCSYRKAKRPGNRYDDEQIEQACEIAQTHGAYRLRANHLNHAEFLELVLQDELVVRQGRLIQRRTKAAAFEVACNLVEIEKEGHPSE